MTVDSGEVPWCVHDTTKKRPQFLCKRCGEIHQFDYPISLDEYSRRACAFIDLHRNCKEKKP